MSYNLLVGIRTGVINAWSDTERNELDEDPRGKFQYDICLGLERTDSAQRKSLYNQDVTERTNQPFCCKAWKLLCLFRNDIDLGRVRHCDTRFLYTAR